VAVLPPERAIWDLEHLADLSTAPNLLLIVSERTSYVLHNLAGKDVHDHWRYALAPPAADIYRPVQDDDSPEWELFLEVAEDVQAQLVEVGRMPVYGIQDAIGTQDVYPVPGAGNYTRSFGPVPDDEMWELQQTDAVISPGTATVLALQVVSAIAGITFFYASPVAGDTNEMWHGRLVLSPGQMVSFAYGGVSAGATLYSRIWFAHLVV